MDGTLIRDIPPVEGVGRQQGNYYTHIDRNSGTIGSNDGGTEKPFVCKSHAGKPIYDYNRLYLN